MHPPPSRRRAPGNAPIKDSWAGDAGEIWRKVPQLRACLCFLVG